MMESAIPMMILEAAARNLAAHPEATESASLQNEICRRHGVILDNLTDGDFLLLEHLVGEYLYD